MSEIAQKAVLMPSVSVIDSMKSNGHSNKVKRNIEEQYNSTLMVHGPMTNKNNKCSIQNVQELMESYKYIGFQATQYGRAADITNSMIVKQPPSKQYVIHDGSFVEIKDDENNVAINKNNNNNVDDDDVSATNGCDVCANDDHYDKSATTKCKKEKLCYPSIFLGITANLVGTGCREAIRFLAKYGVRPRCNRCLAAERKDKDGVSEEKRIVDGTESKTHISESLPNNNIDSDSDVDSDEMEYENDAVLPIEPLWFSSKTSQLSVVHKMSKIDNNNYKNSKLRKIEIEKQSIELPYKSFLDVLVVSGGAIEHDLRQACQPYYLSEYTNDEYRINSKSNYDDSTKCTSLDKNQPQFGNITYEQMLSNKTIGDSQDNSSCWLFDTLMILITKRLKKRQDYIRKNALATMNSKQGEPPVCKWTLTPSQIWKLIGLWLVELMTYALAILDRHKKELTNHNNNTDKWEYISKLCDEYDDYCYEWEEEMLEEELKEHEKKKCEREGEIQHYVNEARQRAETTVVYWAAHQEIPIFSPSFVDGDIMHYLDKIYNLSNKDCAQGEQNCCHSHSSNHKNKNVPFQIDLVQDIHALNKFAMRRRHTGMLICGGGVVKHHICNANLMRNGADKAIFLNNGSEFDGSDAGARPEEALSWGKIRIDGSYVKVYGEVTTTLPLLVAQVFVPAARKALQRHYLHQHVVQEH